MSYVQAVLRKADTDKSSDISFAEFVEYMREHERKLKLAFSDLDHNKDGKTVLLSSFIIGNVNLPRDDVVISYRYSCNLISCGVSH